MPGDTIPPMPRRSAADAQRTRETIVARAVEIASADGLEGVTLGRLAEDLGMSKAGVIGHFGSKEALQLAAVKAARQRFLCEVWRPVEARQPGLDRLVALCDSWLTHIASTAYPGGCFWAAASAEFDGRPGPVRDSVASMLEEWKEALTREVRQAVADGDLDEDTDVGQVLFELRSIGLGLNQELQLHGDESAERRARRAVRRALGRPDLPVPRKRRAAAAA